MNIFFPTTDCTDSTDVFSLLNKNLKNSAAAVCGLRPTGWAYECSYESKLSTLTPELIPVAYRNTASTTGKNIKTFAGGGEMNRLTASAVCRRRFWGWPSWKLVFRVATQETLSPYRASFISSSAGISVNLCILESFVVNSCEKIIRITRIIRGSLFLLFVVQRRLAVADDTLKVHI